MKTSFLLINQIKQMKNCYEFVYNTKTSYIDIKYYHDSIKEEFPFVIRPLRNEPNCCYTMDEMEDQPGLTEINLFKAFNLLINKLKHHFPCLAIFKRGIIDLYFNHKHFDLFIKIVSKFKCFDDEVQALNYSPEDDIEFYSDCHPFQMQRNGDELIGISEGFEFKVVLRTDEKPRFEFILFKDGHEIQEISFLKECVNHRLDDFFMHYEAEMHPCPTIEIQGNYIVMVFQPDVNIDRQIGKIQYLLFKYMEKHPISIYLNDY